MFTFARLSVLGLALCAMTVGGAAPAFAKNPTTPVPAVAVTGHVTTQYLNSPTPRAVAIHWMTLRITGSNFLPGAKVNIGVLYTGAWELLFTGSTRAQRAMTTWVCGQEHSVCSQPNPHAGRIDYRLRLSSAPAASNLLVLYRSAGRAGTSAVTLR